MKKMNLILSSLTLIGLLSFVGCEKNENSTNSSTKISDTTSTEKHKVTFVLNNGEDNIVRDVTHGKYASEPLKITKNNHLVDAWYTDEACTTELDLTDKKVDYLNDNTFYGKMTINEGKAVVLKEITWADKRSDAYKIVFGETSGAKYVSSVQGFTVDTDVANNKYEFEDRAGFSDGLVIYVDGVAQAETATDFTYEANKMYIVNYCVEYTDTSSTINIFK